MNPDDFIRKWDGVAFREKQASQEHFLDLCALVGVDSLAKADPQGGGSSTRREHNGKTIHAT